MPTPATSGATWTSSSPNAPEHRSTGAPIDSRAVRRDWDQLLKHSEVRPARLHDARHTAATTLLIMGVPARVVMQIFGHSQIGLTLGTYSHDVPELATDAADKIAHAYWR